MADSLFEHEDDAAGAPGGTEELLPENRDLQSLRAAAQACHGCPLWKDATQAVFGEGRRSSRLMVVGARRGGDRAPDRLPES